LFLQTFSIDFPVTILYLFNSEMAFFQRCEIAFCSVARKIVESEKKDEQKAFFQSFLLGILSHFALLLADPFKTTLFNSQSQF